MKKQNINIIGINWKNKFCTLSLLTYYDTWNLNENVSSNKK